MNTSKNGVKIAILEAGTVSRGDISFEELYSLGEVTEYRLTQDSGIRRRRGGCPLQQDPIYRGRA